MGVNMRIVYWARVVRVTPGRMARVLLYSRIPDAIRSAHGAVGHRCVARRGERKDSLSES